jgi:hypothetical protein
MCSDSAIGSTWAVITKCELWLTSLTRIHIVHFFQICTKRGPLGACLKTESRTERNDNDVAKKYFRDPSDLIKQKAATLRDDSDDGNLLIQKLRQQSIDNQEKNDLYVARKTFEADQVKTAKDWGVVALLPTRLTHGGDLFL